MKSKLLATIGIAGALVLSTALKVYQDKDTLREEKINYGGKEYVITDSKSEGVVLREFPYRITQDRIVDANRDGRADSFRYTTFYGAGQVRQPFPIDIYPNNDQAELFVGATKDFYKTLRPSQSKK